MELTGIRKAVFLDRYALKDKTGTAMETTPEEMWRRIARGVAENEKTKKLQTEWEEKFYSAMTDFKFVPGGRILSGAGTGYKVTYYNCFVIPSPKDSRGGILETLKQMVEIMARGGGVGINLSSLRPRGDRVKKVNGFSSGPCNWAELFSVATKDIIQQGGTRRGALMLMLWDWHPDIEEFITVKQDLSRINGANLSVCVSDSFMDAVKTDSNWNLYFPDTDDPEYDEKWDGIMAHWLAIGKKPKIYKTIKARKLWDLICEAAWKSAEPGLVFMERYNKWHSNSYFNYINCVNPCVTGDTLVATEHGWIKAKDLIVGTKILTPKGLKPIDKVYNNGKQRVYKVYFSDGGTLSATVDHKLRVMRKNGQQEWVKVSDLEKADQVVKLIFLGTADERRQSNQHDDQKQQQYENQQKQAGIERAGIYGHNFAFLAKYKLIDQETMQTMPLNSTLSQSILSTSTNKGGITATARTTWPMPSVISDSFLSSDLVKRNRSRRGATFLPTEPILHHNGLQNISVAVEKVEDTHTYEDVFDVHEPETLTWITNGYVSLDCGEEGLPAWGVCNLSSINLAALVNSQGEMDYKLLAEIAAVSVRFQDNIIDQDVYVFDGIRETQLNGERRIGLGTMGLGDALIKMKVRYGSAASLPIIEKIYRTIRDAAFAASVAAAREKGAFPKFDAEKYSAGYFIKNLPKELQKEVKQHGVRNSVLLMQAPTGSTSLLSGTSSGIEPVYEFEFLRRDRLGEHILRHPLYEEWFTEFTVREGREPTLTDRPDYFVSANDLTPEDHVRVQAAIQKYVDASISKTVNAPNVHTVADVQKLYMMAYDLGCKGVTYMREGSRAGVLERLPTSPTASQGGPEKKTEPVIATNGHAKEVPVVPIMPEIKPRPIRVTGVTYKMDTPVGNAYVTINTNGHNEPLELFINVGKAGSDVQAMAEGLGRLISLTLRVASPISPSERIRQVARQLSGIGGSRHVGFGENRVKSLPDAIAKVITDHLTQLAQHSEINGHAEKTNGHTEPAAVVADEKELPPAIVSPGQQPLYTKNPAPAHVGGKEFDLCPSCGDHTLAHEEGCKKCYGCGYSEC